MSHKQYENLINKLDEDHKNLVQASKDDFNKQITTLVVTQYQPILINSKPKKSQRQQILDAKRLMERQIEIERQAKNNFSEKPVVSLDMITDLMNNSGSISELSENVIKEAKDMVEKETEEKETNEKEIQPVVETPEPEETNKPKKGFWNKLKNLFK